MYGNQCTCNTERKAKSCRVLELIRPIPILIYKKPKCCWVSLQESHVMFIQSFQRGCYPKISLTFFFLTCRL